MEVRQSTMLQWTLIILGITVCLLSVADAAESDVASLRTIFFDKPVYFSALDGSDIVTAPGDYQVEAESPGLRLIPEPAENKAAHLIAAITTSLDVETREPVALAIRLHEDEYHIILVLPDGKAFEAVGWSSGVRPRGLAYAPLTSAQVKAALRRKRQSAP